MKKILKYKIVVFLFKLQDKWQKLKYLPKKTKVVFLNTKAILHIKNYTRVLKMTNN